MFLITTFSSRKNFTSFVVGRGWIGDDDGDHRKADGEEHLQ